MGVVIRVLLESLCAGSSPAMVRLRLAGFPQAKSANEGIGIVANPATGRQILEMSGIASAQYDVVQLKGGNQPVHAERDVFPPFLWHDFSGSQRPWLFHGAMSSWCVSSVFGWHSVRA